MSSSDSDNLKPDELELDLELDGPEPETSEESSDEPEIITNDYGETRDSAVVIEEDDRTVLLTEDETIIVEKTDNLAWSVPPANRPRKVYTGMWGQAEIVSVGLGLLAVLAVLVLVIFFVFPAQKELEQNRAKRNDLETELKSADKKYGSIQNTQERVDELINSVTDFETRFLRVPTNGQTGLYQELNGLISAYGLVNTSGPDYAPLEIIDPQRRQQAENERGRDKYLSLFPGVYATVTVEGSYQSLRAFMTKIETSNQFIIIAAVELVPADGSSSQENKPETATQTSDSGPPESNEPRRADIYRGKTHGETVSLKLELVSYFRRPDYQPVGPEVAVR